MMKKKRSHSDKHDLDTQSQGDKLKRTIIKTRNIIRKKFRDLHNQKLALNQRVSETLQPIIEPLKSIAKREKGEPQEGIKTDVSIKTETLNTAPGRYRMPDSIFKTALAGHRANVFDSSRNLHNVSGVSLLSSGDDDDDNDEEAVLEDKIIEKVTNLNSPHIDRTYGFRYKDGQLKLGNDRVLTKSTPKGIVYSIRRKTFPATPGVTELLLSDKPKQFKQEDLETYKQMLQHTSAHRKNYQRSGQIVRSESSYKYSNILAQLFPRREKKGGKGIKGRIIKQRPQIKYKVVNRRGTANGSGINYTYWDDPNELVDRLRLLVSSQAAGHTGHDNEIISIVEELREAKIIN